MSQEYPLVGSIIKRLKGITSAKMRKESDLPERIKRLYNYDGIRNIRYNGIAELKVKEDSYWIVNVGIRHKHEPKYHNYMYLYTKFGGRIEEYESIRYCGSARDSVLYAADITVKAIKEYTEKRDKQRKRQKQFKGEYQIPPCEFKPTEERVDDDDDDEFMRIDNIIVGAAVIDVVVVDKTGKFQKAAGTNDGDAWFEVQGSYYIDACRHGCFTLLFDGDKFYPIAGGHRIGDKFASPHLSPSNLTESDKTFLVRVVGHYVKGNN